MVIYPQTIIINLTKARNGAEISKIMVANLKQHKKSAYIVGRRDDLAAPEAVQRHLMNQEGINGKRTKTNRFFREYFRKA